MTEGSKLAAERERRRRQREESSTQQGETPSPPGFTRLSRATTPSAFKSRSRNTDRDFVTPAVENRSAPIDAAGRTTHGRPLDRDEDGTPYASGVAGWRKTYCEDCGAELQQRIKGRTRRFCDNVCRRRHHRRTRLF